MSNDIPETHFDNGAPKPLDLSEKFLFPKDKSTAAEFCFCLPKKEDLPENEIEYLEKVECTTVGDIGGFEMELEDFIAVRDWLNQAIEYHQK